MKHNDPLGDILAALDKRPPPAVRTRRKPSAESLDAVLAALRLGHNVETSCRSANIPMSTVYTVRDADRDYRRAFDSARAAGIEARSERRFHSVAQTHHRR